LSQEESHIANKFCNYIADSLSGSAAAEGVMLKLGDCVNVVLRGIRGNSAGHWSFHDLLPERNRPLRRDSAVVNMTQTIQYLCWTQADSLSVTL
jgi:hypothetical protein